MATSEPYTCPFTIVIDSNEGHPFGFHGLRADADKNFRPLIINVEWKSLGRVENSKGDYSIKDFEHRIGVERKSVEDAWSTILGWETQYEKERSLVGRRERFKKELGNLASLEAAMVVVEGSLENCLLNMPSHGLKSVEENRKIFFRSILSWMIDYKVPWVFCDTRRLAELTTFRFLEMFYKKSLEKDKKESL